MVHTQKLINYAMQLYTHTQNEMKVFVKCIARVSHADFRYCYGSSQSQA